MIAETLTLTRLNLRLKRGYLAAWLIPLWILVAAFPVAYQEYYPTLASRQEMQEAMNANAGTIAIYGRIAEPGTVGDMVTWEVAMWLGVLGSVMAVLLITSLHRRTEYDGVGELQRSTGIRPATPAAAALLTTFTATVLLGTGAGAILFGLGAVVDEFYAAGALAFGVTVFVMTFASALLAELVLLFVSDGSSLTLTALVTIVASFLLRAAADVQQIDWLNWLTPLGWRAQIVPYDRDDWSAATIAAAICLVGVVAVMTAERFRSFGSALVRIPLPKRTPDRRVRGMFGLHRLQITPAVVAWLAVLAVLAAFLMAMSGSIQELVAGEGATGEIFRDLLGGTAAYEAFIGYIAQVCGILIAVAAVSVVHGLRRIEVDRTLDMARSTGIRRVTPPAVIFSWALIVAVALVAVLHAAGAFGLWTQETTAPQDYTTLAWAAWSQLAAAWVTLGFATAVVGLRPDATTASWLVVGVAGTVALVGEIFQFPRWAIDLSPFSHTMVNADSDVAPIVVMLALGAAFIALGLAGAARREVR